MACVETPVAVRTMLGRRGLKSRRCRSVRPCELRTCMYSSRCFGVLPSRCAPSRWHDGIPTLNRTTSGNCHPDESVVERADSDVSPKAWDVVSFQKRSHLSGQRVPSHTKLWPESSRRLVSCSRRLRWLRGRGRRSVPGPVTERRRAKPRGGGGIALAQLL